MFTIKCFDDTGFFVVDVNQVLVDFHLVTCSLLSSTQTSDKTGLMTFFSLYFLNIFFSAFHNFLDTFDTGFYWYNKVWRLKAVNKEYVCLWGQVNCANGVLKHKIDFDTRNSTRSKFTKVLLWYFLSRIKDIQQM